MTTIRVLAVLGLAIGGYLTILHYRAGTGPLNAPFCAVGTVINCDLVLRSPYATLLGQPLALWGAITYLVILLASALGHTALLVFLCGWTLIFSLYLAGVSLIVLKSFCFLCLSLYTINAGLGISAIVLARSAALMTGRQVAASVAVYVLLVLGTGWVQLRPVSPTVDLTRPLSEQNLSAADADFVRFYHSRPQVALSGAERHTEGPPHATLTITEFVDFRCPQCARARAVLSEFHRTHPNDVRIVFRHYPLDQACNPHLSHQVHPGACAAAYAAECAAEQGKFWQYADLLFAEQKHYTRQDLQQYAQAAGLDVSRFTACLNDGRTTRLVRADIEAAEEIKVKATPTLVINGRLIEGLPPFEKLALILALEKQRAAR
ncbi:MAG: thioredoxin domain-containing protein [Candidatus Binatia bacterium]|nr:thioredoxin domain-containing protein [Candidatus Binatia bacterium]